MSNIPSDGVADPRPASGLNDIIALGGASVDLALQLLAVARMAAVLAGMLALQLGLPPSACPFRDGPLRDAYFAGRWQAHQALRGETQ